MATHFTCDRCGTDIHEHGYQREREVTVEWPDARDEKQSVVLKFDVVFPPRGVDGDRTRPDLCDDCYAFILHEVASMLDTDREPAVHG